MAYPTAKYIRCREICSNCPNRTKETPKKECAHLPRHFIDALIKESLDGMVPFDTPERAAALGKSVVGFHDPDAATRPSIELFEEDPPYEPGFVVVEIRKN